MTRPNSLGMPSIRGVQLLPIRPDRAFLENWKASKAASTSNYVIADAELGWCIGPSGSSGLGTSNAQAVRADPDRLYAEQPPEGVLRIVAFGDSFIHGNQVSLQDCWSSQLERTRPGTEIMNFGVPGFGTDQALLRWRREAARYQPDIAVLGIWPENVCRNLNLNRYYLTAGEQISFKPRFTRGRDGLELLGFPIPADDRIVELLAAPEGAAFLNDDRWYRAREQRRPFWYCSRLLRYTATLWNERERSTEKWRIFRGEDAEPNRLTVAIAQQFVSEARALGQEPLILLIPMRELLDEFPGGSAPLPLARDLAAAELPLLDLSARFAKAVHTSGQRSVFQPDGHLTPAGNALVAEALAQHLD